MEAPRTPPPAPRPNGPPELKIRRRALMLERRNRTYHTKRPLTPETNNGGGGICALFNQNPVDPARKRLIF